MADNLYVNQRVKGPNGHATIKRIVSDEDLSICVLYDGWSCVQWGSPEQYTPIVDDEMVDTFIMALASSHKEAYRNRVREALEKLFEAKETAT